MILGKLSFSRCIVWGPHADTLGSRTCGSPSPRACLAIRAESPQHIFLSSGGRGDSYPLGAGALLLSVSFGMQSILCCSAPGRKRELLTAGTPLGRISSPHERGPTPH